MKNVNAMVTGSAILGTVLVLGAYSIGRTVMASGEHEFGESEYEHEHDNRQVGFNDNRNRLRYEQMRKAGQNYIEECGSCHMAYPPGLMPPQSWQKVMSGLEDHFGENAELDTPTEKMLTQFLLKSSAPREGVYRRMFRNLNQAAPLRITQMPYFRRIHNEIPARLIQGNEKVRSLSQCDSCHRDAKRGRFDEGRVAIPGATRWDDD